jgi:hypothetical protein
VHQQIGFQGDLLEGRSDGRPCPALRNDLDPSQDSFPNRISSAFDARTGAREPASARRDGITA